MAKKTKPARYEEFLRTHNGRELLKKHKLTEVGLWRVRGEDSNCDFGGSHYEPELGIFEGTLDDVICIAVKHKGFWQWGAGGSISLVKFEKVSDIIKSIPAGLRFWVNDTDSELLEFEVKRTTTMKMVREELIKLFEKL